MIQQTMAPQKVLIVAHSSESLEPLVARLRDTDCSVEFATTGSEGLRRAAEHSPELVLIDDRLPDTTPLELTMRLRSLLAESPPVFLLTVPGAAPNPLRTEASDADKRGGITQLVDQIVGFLHSAQLRSAPAGPSDGCALRLDRGRHRAWVDGQSLYLTPTEFRLLWELAQRPGYVLSRSELTRMCKGSETAVQVRTIDAHIKSIRRKLKDRAHLIETVHGVGYRLQEVEPVVAD